MVLKDFIYYENKRRKKIKVRVCSSLICKFIGLMFRNSKEPLLFVFNKEKTLSIHSLFCKPFKAIWLDEKKNVKKTENIFSWKLNISGKGKYLLEVPFILKK